MLLAAGPAWAGLPYWSEVVSLPMSRSEMAAGILNGAVYAVGGNSNYESAVYQMSSGTFAVKLSAMGYTAAPLPLTQ